MANTAFINSDQITSIASSMKTKGDNILTEYKQNCIPALNMSTECLQLSGLDTTEFFKALESIYTKLNERITEFSDFLTNTVAVEYDFTSKAIAASFNDEFANEMASLLGITVGGGAAVTAPGMGNPGSGNPGSGNPGVTPGTNAPKTCSGAAVTTPPKTCSGTAVTTPPKTCSGTAVTTPPKTCSGTAVTTPPKTCSGTVVTTPPTQPRTSAPTQPRTSAPTQPRTSAPTQAPIKTCSGSSVTTTRATGGGGSARDPIMRVAMY